MRFYTYFLFLLVSLASCSNDDGHIIVLSKENSQRSCAQFIQRLDTNLVWTFINAYELSDTELEEALASADGIIMTGGADIHPANYSSAADTVKCSTIDTKRDLIEYAILAHVDRTGVPCIGFCRGLQIMNVYGGGSLHLHLPDTLSSIHRGPEGATSHFVQVTRHIASVDLAKNSYNKIVSNHHQGISMLSRDFDAWAFSEDGLIEGIRHSDTTAYPFYVGVQWHPERCKPGNEFDEQIGRSFIEAVISE